MTTILAALSTVAVGLTSGIYWAFTVAVMPGLRDTGDRTFVTSMQAINRRILNPWFLTLFMGSLVLPIAAAIALFVDDDGDARWWGVAGAVAAAVPFAITMGRNVPLNDALDAADPDDNPAATRRAFEGPWTRLNLWRTVTSTAALAIFIRTILLLR